MSTAGVALAARKPVAQRPNVILIAAGELASWMVGCYGNKEIKTPNIDTLARSGIRFSNSFVCTPADSPSRATLFTGRLPRQHGVQDSLTSGENPPTSFAKETMLADVLAGQGYNCGYVGKWHMGGDQQPKHGFHYTYTMLGSSAYGNPEMNENGKLVHEQGYLTDLMTRRASGFLDQQSPSKPFFLTIGYANPDPPYEGHPQKYYDMYAKAKFDTLGWEKPAGNALRDKNMLQDTVGNIRKCAAATTALDDQIPIIMRKLKDKNLVDNTVVIFTSASGNLLGRHGLWGGGLASDPINMYDEVMEVPMIWSWPGKIPAEAVVSELISFYDFFPGICEITGAPEPAGRNLVGRSYAPIVLRERLPKKQPWRNEVYGEFRNTQMLRDKRFKLILRNEGKGPNELYDVTADPREKTNQYENAEFITIRDRMTRGLNEWRRRTAG